MNEDYLRTNAFRQFWIVTIIVSGFILLTACSKKHIKLKIVLECTPAVYFDTLTRVLLSNDYADLGGRGDRSGVNNLFYPARINVNNVKREPGGYFVIDNVVKGQYEYLFVEGYTAGALFSGFKRKLDFRSSSDTAVVSVCIKANDTVEPNE